jgi:uncharacterized membrane protein YedE/YeeE
MNKKVNTLLFILGATLFNVLVAIISFVLLTILYVRFISTFVPERSQDWIFAIIFLASLAISFVVYRYALKFLIKKIDLEKYFDPIFVRKGIRKN